MYNLKIPLQDWPVLSLKLQRKYNHLSAKDLHFQEGGETELIQRLAQRLHRDVNYVVFTLGKELQNLSSNRV